MSNEPLDPESQKAMREFKRILRQKSKEEREQILQEAREEALREELDEERERSQELADELRERLTYEGARREAMDARRTSPKLIMLLLMLLLVLLLLSVATGRGMPIRFPGSGAPVNPEPTLPPRIPGGSQINPLAANAGRFSAEVPQVNSLNHAPYQVSAHFQAYYDQHDGARVFGLPISPELRKDPNGRLFQWFERTRLEEWPENKDTPYAVQGGRIGAEFTRGVTFPKQTFFLSKPGIRYFGETSHGVRTPFLEFWEQVGGLPILGYPISEEVLEKLPEDKQVHIVQYFERGRLEYHPEDTGNEIQLGLLGDALYLQNSKPDIIALVRPTPVPVP